MHRRLVPVLNLVTTVVVTLATPSAALALSARPSVDRAIRADFTDPCRPPKDPQPVGQPDETCHLSGAYTGDAANLWVADDRLNPLDAGHGGIAHDQVGPAAIVHVAAECLGLVEQPRRA